MYTKICDALHQELDMMDERFSNGVKMTSADLDMIDKVTHALKCLKTVEAMEENDYRSRRYERDYRRY